MNSVALVAQARQRAQDLDHEWDRRAIDWPLESSSVVVEVGGYIGRWALQITERYHPNLFVFEPQGWAYDTCKAVLDERATVLPYGLGVEDGYLPMGEYETDGCSFVKEREPYAACQVKDIVAAFKDLDITHIDLMLMNIEGYEYTLLPYMLGHGIAPCRLMVQFHTFADPDGMRLARIYEQLEKVHYSVAWTYGVVLTAWERGC